MLNQPLFRQAAFFLRERPKRSPRLMHSDFDDIPLRDRLAGIVFPIDLNDSVYGKRPQCSVAHKIESAVVDHLRGLLRTPEIVVGTWRAARAKLEGIAEEDVREALERLDPLWDELFPAEQARIVQLLVERVDVSPDGADIHLRTEGLKNLVTEKRAIKPETRRAA